MKSSISHLLSSGTKLLSKEEEELFFKRLVTARRTATYLGFRKKRTTSERSQLGIARAVVRQMRERIITGNLRLVASLAHKFRGRGLSEDDLFSEGLLKLTECVDRFDPGRGNKFSSYLYSAVYFTMMKECQKEGRHQFGRVPSGEDDEESLLQSIPEELSEAPDTIIELREVLTTNRAGLEEVELVVVNGMHGSPARSFTELGLELGLAAVTVQKYYQSALEKLREVLDEA